MISSFEGTLPTTFTSPSITRAGVIITPKSGGFAEKCLVTEKLCLPLPDSMTYEQGAGFTITYATSYHAFRQSTELQAGETVLVLGAAGGVGNTAVEIAKATGARVIAAASSEEKLQFAREAGADEFPCIDHTLTTRGDLNSPETACLQCHDRRAYSRMLQSRKNDLLARPRQSRAQQRRMCGFRAAGR